MGVRATMGIYLDPISTALGMSTGAFGLAIAIQNLVWGLGQPIAGAVADKYGSGRVLISGGTLYAFGLLLAANSNSTTEITFSLGVLTGLGLAGFSFAVILAAVGRLVDESKRTMALAITTAFGSVGQFFLVPTVQAFIDSAGWRKSFALGVVLVFAAVAAVRPLRSASGNRGVEETTGTGRQTLRRAFRHRGYMLLLTAFFVCGFHVTFIAVHLPKYLEDLGQSTRVAALALASIGLFNIAGTIGIGWLGSRYSNTALLAALYAGRAVVFSAVVVIPMSAPVALIGGAALGLVWLATVPLTSAVVLKQFGPEHAGLLFGFVFLSHQIGAFIGTFGAGVYRDAYGSYRGFWWIAVFLSICAAIMHLYIDEEPGGAPMSSQRLRNWVTSPKVKTLGGAASVIVLLVALGAWRFSAILADPTVQVEQAAFFCALHIPGGPLG